MSELLIELLQLSHQVISKKNYSFEELKSIKCSESIQKFLNLTSTMELYNKWKNEPFFIGILSAEFALYQEKNSKKPPVVPSQEDKLKSKKQIIQIKKEEDNEETIVEYVKDTLDDMILGIDKEIERLRRKNFTPKFLFNYMDNKREEKPVLNIPKSPIYLSVVEDDEEDEQTRVKYITVLKKNPPPIPTKKEKKDELKPTSLENKTINIVKGTVESPTNIKKRFHSPIHPKPKENDVKKPETMSELKLENVAPETSPQVSPKKPHPPFPPSTSPRKPLDQEKETIVVQENSTLNQAPSIEEKIEVTKKGPPPSIPLKPVPKDEKPQETSNSYKTLPKNTTIEKPRTFSFTKDKPKDKTYDSSLRVSTSFTKNPGISSQKDEKFKELIQDKSKETNLLEEIPTVSENVKKQPPPSIPTKPISIQDKLIKKDPPSIPIKPKSPDEKSLEVLKENDKKIESPNDEKPIETIVKKPPPPSIPIKPTPIQEKSQEITEVTKEERTIAPFKKLAPSTPTTKKDEKEMNEIVKEEKPNAPFKKNIAPTVPLKPLTQIPKEEKPEKKLEIPNNQPTPKFDSILAYHQEISSKVDLDKITKGRGNEEELVKTSISKLSAKSAPKKKPTNDIRKTLQLLRETEKLNEDKSLGSQFQLTKNQNFTIEPQKELKKEVKNDEVKKFKSPQVLNTPNQMTFLPKDFQLKKTNYLDKK